MPERRRSDHYAYEMQRHFKRKLGRALNDDDWQNQRLISVVREVARAIHLGDPRSVRELVDHMWGDQNA